MSKNLFILVLPGATGGGPYISPIRLHFQNTFPKASLVPSSILSPYGLKRGESLKQHYQNLAQDVSAKLQKRKLILIVESFGAIETIKFLEELFSINDFCCPEIEIVFIGSPGLGQNGLSGLLNTVLAVLSVIRNVTKNEQQVVYPLPESYYQFIKDPLQTPYLKIADTAEKRTARRKFFKQISPMILENPEETLPELEKIDQEIESLSKNHPKLELLLNQRAKILEDPLQKIFHGQQIEPEVHTKIMSGYHSTAGQLSSKTRVILAIISSLIFALIKLDTGVENAFEGLLTMATDRKIKLSFSLAFPEMDSIHSIHKSEELVGEMQKRKLGQYLNKIFFLENQAHSSHGYYPEPLSELIEKLC